MQTFQQYFYETKAILSHIMESRSGKWDIFIKFASSFEVLSFSIRFFAKFGRHFVLFIRKTAGLSQARGRNCWRCCRNCPSRAATRAISAISENTSDINP